MRWVIITLVVFFCALLLIIPTYVIKDKKSKGLPCGFEQDNGGTFRIHLGIAIIKQVVKFL